MALIDCLFCKAKISDMASRCPKCGKLSGGLCPECGQSFEMGQETCQECGFPLARVDRPSAGSSQGEAEGGSDNLCVICGKKVSYWTCFETEEGGKVHGGECLKRYRSRLSESYTQYNSPTSEPSLSPATGSKDIGFTWWSTWAWLGLTIGNLFTLGFLVDFIPLALVLITINTVLMVLVLRFNKEAFLIATILSLNPLVWLVNGLYLRRRWNHPRVNAP